MGLEVLSVSDVVKVLHFWDKDEFVDFVKAKNVDGRKLLEVTEGMVKVWQPKANVKEFISFIEDIKTDPNKYLKCVTNDEIVIKQTNLSDSQYQTVSVRKISQQETNRSVEEILKKIVAPKSFLYRNKRDKTTSYVSMDGGKKKKFFRLSSYDPVFDLKSRFSKVENYDRGYYLVKTNAQKKKPDSKSKYKSLPSPEVMNEFADDHLYEDLCYNDVETVEKAKNPPVKPCMVKIQELFQSFKFPFFKKIDEEVEKEKKGEKSDIYENNDSIADMYDSVHVQKDVPTKSQTTLAVEDYLVPVNIEKDYCDVCLKQREESLLGFIMNYLETRFGRRETSDATQSDVSEVEPSCDEAKWEHKPNMAARPLPVPVENEPFYMNVDRQEAENLLLGQPDGTFILRPSSQQNHAYTISVSCGGTVHNVGVRRRPDGRLALGFARRGERSFATVTSLLQHHKKRRLLLVAAGDLIGATTLNESLQYYATPKNIPIPL